MEGSLMPGVTSDTSRLYKAPLSGSEEDTRYVTWTGKHPGESNVYTRIHMTKMRNVDSKRTC